MSKPNIKAILRMAPVIPVVTLERVEDAVPLGRALVAGGLSVVEITLRTEAAIAADRTFLEAMIHYEVDTDLFGLEQARRSISRVDPQLRAALTHFQQALSMLEAARARREAEPVEVGL